MQRLTALAALSLASCASIVVPADTSVTVTSEPTGATFTSDVPGVSGVTPKVVTFPNGEPVQVKFELAGYEDMIVVSRPRVSSWLIGNLVSWGLVGILVDVVNESTRVHKKRLSVVLTPAEVVTP